MHSDGGETSTSLRQRAAHGAQTEKATAREIFRVENGGAVRDFGATQRTREGEGGTLLRTREEPARTSGDDSRSMPGVKENHQAGLQPAHKHTTRGGLLCTSARASDTHTPHTHTRAQIHTPGLYKEFSEWHGAQTSQRYVFKSHMEDTSLLMYPVEDYVVVS